MAADGGAAGELLQAKAAWVGMEQHPVIMVNQFVGQVDHQGGMVLTVGQALATPMDPSEAKDKIKKGETLVIVQTLARFALTRRAVEDLRTQLGTLLEIEDRFQRTVPSSTPGATGE